MSGLYRGPSTYTAYQVSVHLAVIYLSMIDKSSYLLTNCMIFYKSIYASQIDVNDLSVVHNVLTCTMKVF
jgi:hypothetical protein